MKKNKNITAYSIQDFSQCQHKTWLDFLETPKDFSKNYDPWLEIIRKISIMLYPVIPSSSLKALNIFNLKEKDIKFETIKKHDFLTKNTKINKIDILFNKIQKND